MCKQKTSSYPFPATREKEKMKRADFLNAKPNSVLHSGKQQNSIVRLQVGKLRSLTNANVINCLFINYLLLVNIISEAFIRENHQNHMSPRL